MRLGDLVIDRNDPESLIYQITHFDGNRAILKVMDLPLITFLPLECLVKISSSTVERPFRVIKGKDNRL
ncbi:hypothetical protein BBF96_05805 [Anoxybacter fermentans]|uniref:CarD-like/TRCF RNAP-interacting domain-containing protein n=1 Tax=Anoxybacter fermentans TaxID=1323375 RepID=A0A3S9SXC4_9FIRM|nr:hypothetical protein [Anoxybacter fermentans]AZR72949.1 hypothetical protein BBF96_05805 [Anoxybacter fermentans]